MALLLFSAAGLLESVHGSIGYWLSGRPELGYTLRGQPLSFFDILARAMPSWIVLGVLAGLAWKLAERRPLFATEWKRSLLFHLPLAALFSATFLLCAALIRHFMFVAPETGIGFGTTLLRYYTIYFNTHFLFYWGIVGLYSGSLHYQNLRERELHSERLQRSLTEARLRALQQQLEPHFLFNTLNAVSGLAQEGNVNGTVRTLALLGDLLRETLRRTEQVVTVRKELELLDLYLAIQRVRLEERLQIRTRIEPDILDAEVPTFLLQPIVENAIRHGVARESRPGWIEIAIRRRGQRVCATVTDSGNGLAGGTVATGVGVSNCVARLEQLYGREHSFRLANVRGAGASAVIEWPLRKVESQLAGSPSRAPQDTADAPVIAASLQPAAST
jgi:two-component system, LytTR family, sensor kinase